MTSKPQSCDYDFDGNGCSEPGGLTQSSSTTTESVGINPNNTTEQSSTTSKPRPGYNMHAFLYDF